MSIFKFLLLKKLIFFWMMLNIKNIRGGWKKGIFIYHWLISAMFVQENYTVQQLIILRGDQRVTCGAQYQTRGSPFFFLSLEYVPTLSLSLCLSLSLLLISLCFRVSYVIDDKTIYHIWFYGAGSELYYIQLFVYINDHMNSLSTNTKLQW